MTYKHCFAKTHESPNSYVNNNDMDNINNNLNINNDNWKQPTPSNRSRSMPNRQPTKRSNKTKNRLHLQR